MIIKSDPPAESTAIVAREIALAIGTGSLARLVGRPIRPEAVTLTLAHAFVVLSVTDVRKSIVPAIAGWRYLIEVDREVVAQASTYLDGGNHRFGGFSAGALVVATIEAARVAEAGLGANPERFTLRVAEVPALHVTLLQVTRADGSPHAFVPIGPDRSLAAARLHTPDEVRAVLLERVEQALHVPHPIGDERFGT
jgi:hypothetical protein